MSKVEDKLFQDFYNFWRWEYTKRNDKFKREFEVAVELNDCVIEEGFICSDAFPLSHFIGDYKIDITYESNKSTDGWMRYCLSSDDIVANAFRGSLSHDYPRRIEFPSDMQYSMMYDELCDGLLKIKGMEYFKIDRENKNYWECPENCVNAPG